MGEHPSLNGGAIYRIMSRRVLQMESTCISFFSGDPHGEYCLLASEISFAVCCKALEFLQGCRGNGEALLNFCGTLFGALQGKGYFFVHY